MVKVRLAGHYAALAGGARTVEAEGATVREVLERVEAMWPGLADGFLTPGGPSWKHASVRLNGRDVRFLAGLDTPARDGDEVAIIPPLAGG